jgi:hypothetical protein
MGYVALAGKKMIPAPFVGISREYKRNGDTETKLSTVLTFNVVGKAVKGKGGFTHTGSGYPADDYTQEPLEDLLAKIEDLEALVEEAEWVWLEIQPDPESSAPSTKYRVRPASLTLPDAHWVNYSDYTLTLEGQVEETDHAQEVDESWSLTLNEEPVNTYTLNHTVSCSSKATYLESLAEIREGWKNAQKYVETFLGGTGVDAAIVEGTTDNESDAAGGGTYDFGFMLAASFIAYDHVITQNIDEAKGTYSITESWQMSEEPFNESQQIVVNTNRDAYPVGSADVTISISGEIIGFRQDDETGYSDALNHWETSVEPDLFADASAKLPGGHNALNTAPVSKQVTYNEITRTVSYNYQYDNGTGSCVQDLTVNVSKPDSSCPDITVTVSGMIQGIKTETETAWAKAQACWASLEPTLEAEATSAYTNFGGTGTLYGPHNTSYGQSEVNAKITFSRQWTDQENALLHEIRISDSFSSHADANSMTVDGTIKTICSEDQSYNDVLAEFTTNGTAAAAYAEANALYAGNDSLNESPLTSSVNYNERQRTITYAYSFGDSGEDAYEEQITYNVSESSSNCGRATCNMSGVIQGRRTSGGDSYSNALARFQGTYATASPTLVDAYLSNAKNVSKKVTYDDFNNKISFQYDYSNEAEDWIIDETITESWGEECGYATISKNGTVTGICDGTLESAYTNAVAGYEAEVEGVKPPGAQYLNRRSISHSRRQGKVSYSEEYTNRPNKYKVDETVTEESTATDRADTLTYAGTVTGFCTDVESENIKFSNAWQGWIDRLAEIETEVGTGYIEMRRSVGKNKLGGTVVYNLQYRENNGCIAGSLRESMSVTDEYATDIFAVVPVLGGPAVIQDKGGTNVLKRTVNISASFPIQDSCNTAKPSGVEALVEQQKPQATIVLVGIDTEAWDPLTGSYTRTKSWTYTDCS